MTTRTALALGLAAALLFAGCDQAEPGAESPVVEDAAGDSGTPASDQPVGMIASGTTEAVATVAEPVAPTSIGIESGTSAEMAAEKVPFGLLEPVDLPPTTYRDLVRLTEPDPANQAESDAAGLPKVRFIYSTGDGSLVLVQSAATGEPGEGEPIAVGAHSGWQVSDDPPVLVWEQDGVRLEMRGNGLSFEVVMAAAASMAPLGAWPGPLEAPNVEESTATADAAATAGTPPAGTPAPTG
jgi:hypothetical protein